MARNPTVAIIGAGFSGLGTAIALKRAGFGDLTIYEQADRIGGVWRENTYPGAACDVPSFLYSYSFEPKYDWSEPYARQEEILGYLNHCASKYGLEPHLRLGTPVSRVGFDEQLGRWRLELPGGESAEADVLVAACGQLRVPSYPEIAGLDRFRGPCFHSARWDHDFDPTGKRVAVIGTGASAIQIVPSIAPQVRKLDLFQRSAPYVVPKRHEPYRPWEMRMHRRFPVLQRLHRLFFWLLAEYLIIGFIRNRRVMSLPRWFHRRQLDEQITDPELRSRLEPTYEIGCKRVGISSEYLPALAKPNVELVTERVAEVTESGVVTADGTEREVDALILATGFKANEFLAPMEIAGLGGRDLNEAWRDGAEAYLGMNVSGFPNMFILYGPNTNLGSGSIIYMLESQFRYVVDAMRTLARTSAGYLDVRPDVQQDFNREVQQRLDDSVWSGCTSWYRTESGKVVNNWPGFMLEFRRKTRRVELGHYRLASPAVES